MPSENDYDPETYPRSHGAMQTREIKKMRRRNQVLAAQSAVHVVHRRQGLRARLARVLRAAADRLDT